MLFKRPGFMPGFGVDGFVILECIDDLVCKGVSPSQELVFFRASLQSGIFEWLHDRKQAAVLHQCPRRSLEQKIDERLRRSDCAIWPQPRFCHPGSQKTLPKDFVVFDLFTEMPP